MADIPIYLPNGTKVEGDCPVVIIGPNGSGKTRVSRQLRTDEKPLEFVNALRNTRISPQLPAMSQQQARSNHEGARTNARSQPWEISSDFDFILAELLATDGDAARSYRAKSKAGEDLDNTQPTALEIVESVWSDIFPGRTLEWKDWSPVINNDHGQTLTYGANQMSDGERAALYLLAKTLLAPGNQVLVVDEPETHFHSLLAIRLWNAIEKQREDLRFVYVTHDLSFALSRESAVLVLADPRNSLTVINVDDDLPADVRKEILGAASFSYYASRIVFCEGTDASFDQAIFSSWFNARDTVVVPVGSCDSVKHCVRSLSENRLIENLEAIGIVDRDSRPDEYVVDIIPQITVLPFHEIEGMMCLPEVIEKVAAHLGQTVSAVDVQQAIVAAIDESNILMTASERAAAKLLNLSENHIRCKPSRWTEADVRASLKAIDGGIATVGSAHDLFEEELAALRAIVSAGDSHEILKTFPCKPILGKISRLVNMTPSNLCKLISSALANAETSGTLQVLGHELLTIYSQIGLPPRTVEERATTIAPA